MVLSAIAWLQQLRATTVDSLQKSRPGQLDRGPSLVMMITETPWLLVPTCR